MCLVKALTPANSVTFLFYGPLQDSESQSKVVGPEPQYLDEFTSLLVPDDTRVMVDLLKLAVSCRSGEKGKEVLSAVLSGMGTAYPQVTCCIHTFPFIPCDLKGRHLFKRLTSRGLCGLQVADMLLELCVTELEDVATDSQSGRLSSQPVVVESSHPYTDDTSTSGTVKIPGKQGTWKQCLVYTLGKCVHLEQLE